MRIWRTFALPTFMSIGFALAGANVEAQTPCEPGISAGFNRHPAVYNQLINALGPQRVNLRVALTAVVNQATYQTLLNIANTVAGSIPQRPFTGHASRWHGGPRHRQR